MHVGRGERDVAQRGGFEFAEVAGDARDAAYAEVDGGIFDAVVIEIAGHKVIGLVASGAGGSTDLAEKNLPTESFLGREVTKVALHSLVIFRLIEDNSPDDLCNAVRRHRRSAECPLEKVSIKWLDC